MKKDTKKTAVLFLKGEPIGELYSEVIAYFPNENYYSKASIGYKGVTDENWQDMKMSYAHIGQHSSCHIEYANECKQATKEQYNDLAKELESIGYNLNILNK